jgi:hypothetical protein
LIVVNILYESNAMCEYVMTIPVTRPISRRTLAALGQEIRVDGIAADGQVGPAAIDATSALSARLLSSD